MYEEHFGFTATPFSIAPDPRYLFMSEQHREALAHLLYGIKSDGGFVMLTGGYAGLFMINNFRLRLKKNTREG